MRFICNGNMLRLLPSNNQEFSFAQIIIYSKTGLPHTPILHIHLLELLYYLAIPASSVTSERAFKVAKFASKYRFRLKAVNLERILFLSYNLEALGHPLLHEMKTPPPDFQKPNGPLNFKFTHFQPDNAPDDGTSD